MQINYTSTLKAAKAAARDMIRTEKVSDLLGWIKGQNARVTKAEENIEQVLKETNEKLEEAGMRLQRIAYTLKMATETGNPDLEDITEDCKEKETFYLAQIDKITNESADYVTELNTELDIIKKAVALKVAEYEEKIENWNTGKSKVDAERQTSIAVTITKARIEESFKRGDYDTVENTEDEASS